jgi:hypothetical protein
MKNVSDNCRQNQNTQILFNHFFLNRKVYEIMSGNILQLGSTIRRMRIACWITKATNAHSEYIIRIAFSSATIVSRTRLNIVIYTLLYVHCLSGLYQFCSSVTTRKSKA